MCGDGNGLRWVTDHTVDQLTACKGRQTPSFNLIHFIYSIIYISLNPEQAILLAVENQLLQIGCWIQSVPSLVCVSSAVVLCSVLRSYSSVSPLSNDTTTWLGSVATKATEVGVPCSGRRREMMKSWGVDTIQSPKLNPHTQQKMPTSLLIEDRHAGSRVLRVPDSNGAIS